MAAGGIYDHLGGGFARYSTDRRWLVPHFEKMLYDQALLARVYLHGWQVTGDARLPAGGRRDHRLRAAGAASSARRVLLGRGRRLRGGRGQVLRVVARRGPRGGRPTPSAAIAWYGATAAGNWEGTNILDRRSARPAPALRRSSGPAARCSSARGDAGPPGARRQGPHRVERADAGLARRGGRRHGRRPSGSTPRSTPPSSWSPSSARRRPVAAFLAGPVDGGSGRAGPRSSATPPTTPPWSTPSLAWPRRRARPAGLPRPCPRGLAARPVLGRDSGGLFTTGSDAEALVARPKDLMDNALPGQQPRRRRPAAARRPHRRRSMRQPAEIVLRLLGEVAGRAPLAFGHLLSAIDLRLRGITEVVITGDRPDLVTGSRRD